MDSDILKNCDLVKIPASIDGSWAGIPLDILLYLIPFPSAMGAVETLRCKAAMDSLRVVEQYDRELKPLTNLFFVISKAHLAGNMEEARAAAKRIGTYIYRTIPPSYWTSTGRVCGQEDFLSRFFLYTRSDPKWNEDFYRELRWAAEEIPKVFEKAGISAVDSYRNMACKILDAEIQQKEEERRDSEEYKSLVSKLEYSEADSWAEIKQKKDKVVDTVRICRMTTRDEFRQSYQQLLSNQNIAGELLDDSAERCNSAQLQQIGSRLNSELEQEMKKMLLATGLVLSDSLKEYLAAFEKWVEGSGFPVRGSYMKALRSKKILGAMSQQIGIWDVGMNSELLRSAGETVQEYVAGQGGTDSAGIEARSMGTDGSGIGTKGETGMRLMGLFFGGVIIGAALAAEKPTSKSKVQSRIQKVYTSEDVLSKYTLCLDHYWEDTLSAFLDASENLEQAWKSYFDGLKDAQPGEAAWAKRMETARKLKAFFETLSI